MDYHRVMPAVARIAGTYLIKTLTRNWIGEIAVTLAFGTRKLFAGSFSFCFVAENVASTRYCDKK